MNLYQHQKDIVADDPKKCGLFLGTGSGKTRVALLLARGSTLVIAPKTQVEDGNWQREYGQISGPVVGNVEHKEPLTVISKETFRRDWEKLPKFDTVIVDEAHTCLGVTPNTKWVKREEHPKTSQLYEALDKYLRWSKPERIYLCTATIMKSPMTVWGAMRILGQSVNFIRMNPETGREEVTPLNDYFTFRRIFYVKLPMPGRAVYVPRADEHTKTMLAKIVRRLGKVGRLEDFFDVPDQTFRTIHVDLTKEQKRRIEELTLEYPDPFVRVGKRHQIENGCLAGDDFNASEHFESQKIDKILELAEEFPHMVIFAKYRAQIEAIKEALQKAKFAVWTLTGDTTDRGAVLEAVNASRGILVAQAQISAGWEVPQAPAMVFASRTYSFVDYDQALGRIQRANNIKKNLYVDLVVRGGIDEAVDRALRNKQDFNEHLYAEN